MTQPEDLFDEMSQSCHYKGSRSMTRMIHDGASNRPHSISPNIKLQLASIDSA
jgi:hypothetical protein